MAYNQKNYQRTAAKGVFHTDGISISPNDPTPAYLGLGGLGSTNDLVDQGLSVSKGKVRITTFNQKSQLNNAGNLSTADALDLSRAYGTILRESS